MDVEVVSDKQMPEVEKQEQQKFLKSFESAVGSKIYSRYEKEITMVAGQLDEAIDYWLCNYYDIVGALPICRIRVTEAMGVFDELLIMQMENKIGIM